MLNLIRSKTHSRIGHILEHYQNILKILELKIIDGKINSLIREKSLKNVPRPKIEK